MIKSMTAFAAQSIEESWGLLECELRSVNHRYLEIQIRLPDELRRVETQLREQISRRIRRGKLECVLRFKAQSQASSEIQLNIDYAAALVKACKQVTKQLHQPSEINPLEILAWPGVVIEAAIDMQPVIEKNSELIELALDDLIAGRQAEGQRLQAQLEQRLGRLQQVVADEKQRRPQIAHLYREKLLSRLTELNIQHDADRLEQELAYLAQKMDVDEELDRLQSHFAEIESIFKRHEPVGRRLDFIMQEMNREANTLGSKSVDIKTTQASVELKVLIEQMREQVQNIE